ncbi:chemotaxis protein CheW [Natronorubrum sp. JWXQ-INN-674]|uniref:Chemotaxis protein CheW n=1 Tax=Natronorubrum halalkaliphilum TaxID=2691917 RepID=A0A6B0VSI2_9EURY|nr:chemotaxis protein CheW [Natronorubrum halalkaliphilum]MXV64007.1 chemotaxis protein CheW [Natronorubrum halalkaliphilum]
MAPDLSEKLLGIDIGEADDRTRRDADDADEEHEELERFVYFGVGEHRLAVPVDAVRTLAERPDELTRVPRAPAAIEGMVDLRGEVTAVIEPSVHFPVTEPGRRDGREQLLVLDRPADRQSAALRVDDVIGVESVPESDILDEAALDEQPLSAEPLEHPLVAGIIKQERDPEPELESEFGDVGATNEARIETASGGDASSGGGMTLSSPRGPSQADSGSADGETFELGADDAEAADDGESTAAESEETASTREVVIEATPLIDVERFLLASGQRE